MDCVTIKAGYACPFMSKKGCTFNGGKCHPIIDKCEGCDRILDLETGRYCMISPDPAMKWRHGNCNMATHTKSGNNGGQRAKLNPLKASKRGASSK
ncbi:MAG: hypothetical protein BZ151_08985 [Desulfobacca sp. 4484_104]|nr:MAG: hypothetical protein BZ151_08985 [Desulfobacca sp. 4484_104]RLA87923.1 MAG: hypothetical protein DRG58_09505 [Deltaproteobacteria bacterium]